MKICGNCWRLSRFYVELLNPAVHVAAGLFIAGLRNAPLLLGFREQEAGGQAYGEQHYVAHGADHQIIPGEVPRT